MKPSLPSLALANLLALAALSARADVLERVVAKVNGDIVTLSEFEGRQLAAVQQARVGPESVPAFLQENNARILQDLIDELLLVQRAAELGMRLRAEYVGEVVEGIKKENHLESDDALREQLRREGMSLEDLKRQVERSILRRQILSRELEGRATPSEPELRAEYEARKADYTRGEQARLLLILLKGDAAAAQAEELVRRARAGEDFGELARAHSADPSAAGGGDLGLLPRGDLNPALEAVAFSLPVGGVSDPIPGADGVRILKLQEREEARVVPFEQARGEIRDRMLQERWAKEYAQYIEGLRKGAVIHVMVREVPLQLEPTAQAPTLGGRPGAPGLPPTSAPGVAPAPGPAAPDAPPSDAEFAVTPQDKPERVAPAPAPEPKPEETPASPPPS